jgi:hypothetical protein
MRYFTYNAAAPPSLGNIGDDVQQQYQRQDTNCRIVPIPVSLEFPLSVKYSKLHDTPKRGCQNIVKFSNLVA